VDDSIVAGTARFGVVDSIVAFLVSYVPAMNPGLSPFPASLLECCTMMRYR
jgi:hypothetical protein